MNATCMDAKPVALASCTNKENPVDQESLPPVALWQPDEKGAAL